MFKDDYYIIIKNPTKKELKKEDGIRDNIYFALVYKQKIFKENLFIRALGQSEISKLLTNIYYKQYKIKRKRLSDDENKKIISDIKEILEEKEKIIIDDKEMILDSSFKAKEFKKKSIRKKSLIGGGLGAAIGIGIITSAILNNNNNNEDKLEDTNIKTENTNDKKIEISNDIEILVADDEIKPNPVEITKNEYDVNIPVFETDNIINSKHYSYESNNDLFNKIYYSYGQYFENYGNKYGIDPYLLCAISCQENPTLIKRTDKNAGYGLMQIEYSQWNDKDLSVYNYETKQKEVIHIDCEKCQEDIENCVLVGTAIMQNTLYTIDRSNLNNGSKFTNEECAILALSAYNDGGVTLRAIKECNTFSETLDYINNTKTERKIGDPNYIKNVFKFIPDGTTINLVDLNQNLVSYTVDNTENNLFRAPENAKRMY